MNILPVLILIPLAGYVCADTTLDTMVGVSITAYESSPVEARSRETLLGGLDPKDVESPKSLTGYHLKWKVSVPESRIGISDDNDATLVLKVWDCIGKHFPGWNPPIVEIFSGQKRVACQELTEVGWALDVLSDTQGGLCLSILTAERHRLAKSTNIYRLNPDSMTFEHQGAFFSKEELRREGDEWRAMHANRKPQQGEQAGTGQPAPRSESDSEGSDKPQPEAEGRSR